LKALIRQSIRRLPGSDQAARPASQNAMLVSCMPTASYAGNRADLEGGPKDGKTSKAIDPEGSKGPKGKWRWRSSSSDSTKKLQRARSIETATTGSKPEAAVEPKGRTSSRIGEFAKRSGRSETLTPERSLRKRKSLRESERPSRASGPVLR